MTIHRVSIAEQIREYLLEQIARGQLCPGERVVEAQVAAAMRVSSIPVREAIRELVAMGILESAPHRGAWVRRVSVAETIQAFQVRSVLEPLAVELAGPRLRERCAELRCAVQQIVAAAKDCDFAAFQHHNQLFHRAIVAAAGNDVLLRVWDGLAFEVRTRFTMDYLTTVNPVTIARQHRPIVDALERGCAVEAAALLRSHSSGLVDYLRAQPAHEQDAAEPPRKQVRGRKAANRSRKPANLAPGDTA